MRLRDIMTVDIVTISPREHVDAARAAMQQHRIRHLVVVDAGRVVGVISDRDVRGPGENAGNDFTVQDLMSADVVGATPETTVRQAANRMRGRSVGCLPVVENEKLIGIVTATDLLDQFGRGGLRPTVRTEPAPLPPPGSGFVRGRAVRLSTGPKRGGRQLTPRGQRAPLPAFLPRPVKLARDRTDAVSLPTHVRVIDGAIGHQDRDYIGRKLGMRLGKFASVIERITVRLSDANGPKGGRDQKCQIKVVLSGLPSIVVNETDSTLPRIIDRAIGAAALAVRRVIQRRRLKPLHHRASHAPA